MDFIIDRFFMKFFRTTNMDTVRLCQEYFNFELPSDRPTVKRRTLKFKSTFVSTLVKMYS